ncbi:mucin-2 isoform X2 [Malaya genurostris]|uniref:mucin-2 isoform X2 n=1 Tax=Malaya genurostris TaxID=325434 RepID=UPI0026F3DEF3|nr:mucin-2 isoform X2 [Malaya genurostris]
MSSKPRRGTVRWSHQRCTTSRTTNALLLTSLTVFLSNLLSTAHGNPMHPFSSALAIGRNLRHLPCVVRSTGDEGICMFAIDCFKANGTHLGVCIDKIFFGSCCQVRHITHSLVDTNKKPPLTETRLPTTTVTPQNATKYVPSSTSSTTTLRTTTKFVRRNVTSPTTTVKAEVKDDVPSDYQEFSTFQYVQGSKNPELTTTGAIRRTTTKPVTKPTTRKPPPRTTISPNKTRKPVPSRNNTRAPVTPMTTPKTVVTTLTEAKKNVSSYTTVTRRPVTPSETTTHSSRRPTTASSTTVRRTTTLPKRPVTMAVSSEETSFHSFTRRPTTQPTIIPMTRPVHRRRPTTTPTEEPETTRAPRPRPRPTPEIATVPATALDHLLDDLITTTLREGTSAESSNVKTTSSSRYPITTVKITEATTPTPTPTTTTTTTTRKSTIPSTTTAELTSPAKATTTTTQTTTTRTTTPTTTSTTTTTEKPTTTTTVKSTVPTTTTTSTSTTAPTTATTTTTTTSVPETTATNIKTTTSSTPTTPKTTTTTVGKTTTTSPKTTTSGRITPPADIDYPPETSQLHNLLDETTAGSGLVTWSSIVDYVSSEKQPPEQAPAGPTTSNSWILIHTLTPEEVLSTNGNQTNNHSSTTQFGSTSTLIDQALPSLPQNIALPALESLLPEAAYIYTIHDETNQTTTDEFISHSPLASSSSSTEDTLGSFSTITKEPSISIATSTAPATTIAVNNTSSEEIEKIDNSTTSFGTSPDITPATEDITSTMTPEPTTIPTTTTTVATTTTTTTVSSTREPTTSSTTATDLTSSNTDTDDTAMLLTGILTQLQSGSATQSSTFLTTITTEQDTSPAATTNTPAILIEILGPSTPAPKEPSSTQPATSPTSTVEELITETTEEGSTEEGSGSEEESSEEETFSSGSYETTSEPTSPTPVLLSELDKWGNTTLISSLGTTESSSSSESSTVITSSTTLNITSSLQSIASMFNISTSTGMPVRFPIDNSTGTSSPAATDGVTISPDFITTSTVPSLEGIDYRAVCGKRMFPEPRIVGGTKASFGRWPWQISLRQWRTSTYLHKCGAALLNENWAITAAHCVDNVPPSDLLLRLGEYDLALEEEPYGYQERRVQIVASHPQFDPRTFEYDLALLRFYEPVIFQPNIIPVCVPDGDENFIGRTAFVTGWGRLYEDGPLPSVLQEVTVPVIENKICETMYRSAGYIEHIPHIFICAGWKKGGYDSCEGDSGGPMVIQRPDKRFLLAGVISWGIGCAEANQPGVYTRISEFRDWINQILQF